MTITFTKDPAPAPETATPAQVNRGTGADRDKEYVVLSPQQERYINRQIWLSPICSGFASMLAFVSWRLYLDNNDWFVGTGAAAMLAAFICFTALIDVRTGFAQTRYNAKVALRNLIALQKHRNDRPVPQRRASGGAEGVLRKAPSAHAHNGRIS